MLQLWTDLLFFFMIVINRDLVCHPGVHHLCSFTSSYAYIISLHDNPGGGSLFKNNSDLDYLEWGLVHALDSNVRDNAVEDNGSTHRQTGKSLHKSTWLVSQIIVKGHTFI